MSRSGYSDDCDDQWALIRWRGAVKAAIRGKRGQAFLREMLSAMDSLPEKKLIARDLEADGAFCALGTVAHQRNLPMGEIDPYDHERVAELFGIAHTLGCEIMWINDDGVYGIETDEQRFQRVRAWVVENLADAPASEN